MHDQADELRNLVRKAMWSRSSCGGPPPRMIALTGGKGGVGTTTVALNLAVAFCQLGKRVVFLDADMSRSDAAHLCGLDDTCNLADVLAGRRDVHEIMQPGPAGLQVIPGVWAPDQPVEATPLGQRRLIRELKSLGRHADLVVMDTGTGAGELAARLWHCADQAILVTSPEPVAVMDTYATLKMLLSEARAPALAVLVTGTTEAALSADVHRRLDASCRRFLRLGLELAGAVPDDPAVESAAGQCRPVVLSSPLSPAAKAINRIAASLAAGPCALRATA